MLQFLASGGEGTVQYESSDEEVENDKNEEHNLVDVEELGNVMHKMKTAK